jgi:hypothetical protein
MPIFLFLVRFVCFILAVTTSMAFSSSAPASDLRPFTVTDSIEMTRFVDPPERGLSATPQFSPDGLHFLVVTQRGNVTRNLRDFSLLIFDAPALSKAPERIVVFRTSSNRPGIDNAKWLDNESISLIGENPNELPQVYLVKWRTRNIKKVTSAPSGVFAYDISSNRKVVAYYTAWSGDEKEIQRKISHGFAVTNEQLRDLASGGWRHPHQTWVMCVENLATGKVRVISPGPFQLWSTRLHIWLSPDGRYAVTEQGALSVPAKWKSYKNGYVSRLARDMEGKQLSIRPYGLFQAMLVDIEMGQLRPLLNAPMLGVMDAAWSSDSSTVFVSGTYLPLEATEVEDAEERRSLAALVAISASSLRLSLVSFIPENEVWLLDSRNLFRVSVNIYYDNETGENATRRVTRSWEKSGEQWKRVSPPNINDRRSEIHISEALDRWPKLVESSAGGRAETVVFDPNPQLTNRKFGRVEQIHWTGKRGETLTGGLVYPTDFSTGQRYPLVIQTHGFDPSVFLTDGPFTTALAAQELANRGFVVLQIGDSPLFEKAENTLDEGPVEQSQIESAIDHLDQFGLIDRARVALVGFSTTGSDVWYMLTHSNYHFAAATIAEGNNNGYFAYVVTANGESRMGRTESVVGGPPWSNNWNAWSEHSLSFEFEKIHTPVRLESDSNSAVNPAVLFDWETFVALKRLKKPVELIFVTDGDHPVVKPWHRMTSQQGNVEWLAFWLKGAKDPDALKADQYARWGEMKDLQRKP